MQRFHFLLAILVLIVVGSSTISARNVHHHDDGSDSSSHESMNVSDCRSGSGQSNDSLDFQSNTTSTISSVNTTGDNISNDTTSSEMDILKGASSMASIEKFVIASSSASEEMQESNRNGTEIGPDQSVSNSTSMLVDNDSNSMESTNSSMNSTKSNESGQSGEDSNAITNSDTIEQRVVALREKVKEWQNAVSDYVHTTRRRRQADWGQLFPASASAKDPTNSLLSAAGSAVGDALKPAMELMNQGLDLLNDLYSTHLTKPTGKRTAPMIITNENNQTQIVADQFRSQMEKLQTKLADLGKQLEKVVGTFQDLQVPFLDGLMASSGGLGNLGGLFSFDNIQSPTIKQDSHRSNAVYKTINNNSKKDGNY